MDFLTLYQFNQLLFVLGLPEDARSCAKLLTKRNLDLVYKNLVPFTHRIILKLKALSQGYRDGIDKLIEYLLDYEEIKTQDVVAQRK